MKNLIITILLVAALALGAWGLSQQQRIMQLAAQIAQAEAQLAAVKAALQKQTKAFQQSRFAQTQASILQEKLSETAARATEQSRKTEQLQQSLAAAKTNNPLSSIATMFKDAKLREMMKTQQKAFMGPVLDKQYGALFQQLNLTHDQVTALRDLVQKKMLAGADMGFSLLDSNLDSAQRADLVKQVKNQTDSIDNQIKQFLGDQNYQTFQTYEKTLPERMTVGQLADQLTGTATALSAEQQQQLVQAMGDVRGNFKWTVDLSQQNAAGGDFTAMFTEANINTFAQEKERLDQQTLTKAQAILTPDQLTAFQDFQKTQRELQIAGMRMAAQMFAPKGQ
jgi:hypothetical protein